MLVIKHQIDGYERAAQGVADLLHDTSPKAELIAWDVDGLAEGVVRVYEDMGRATEHLQRVPRLKGLASGDLAREFHGFHVRLASVCRQVSELIRTVEGWGYRVAARSEFDHVWRTARGVASLSIDDVLASADSAARGELQPLRAFRDELRAAPIAQG